LTNNWIKDNRIDPRLPTAPEYVSVNALAKRYDTSLDDLVKMAEENPRFALSSGGNPWTETSGKEMLFLNERAVAKRFEDSWN